MLLVALSALSTLLLPLLLRASSSISTFDCTALNWFSTCYVSALLRFILVPPHRQHHHLSSCHHRLVLLMLLLVLLLLLLLLSRMIGISLACFFFGFFFFIQPLLSALSSLSLPSYTHQFIYLLYCLLWLLHFASTTAATLTATAATIANSKWKLISGILFISDLQLQLRQSVPGKATSPSRSRSRIPSGSQKCDTSLSLKLGREWWGIGNEALHKRNTMRKMAKMTATRQTKWLANQATNAAKTQALCSHFTFNQTKKKRLWLRPFTFFGQSPTCLSLTHFGHVFFVCFSSFTSHSRLVTVFTVAPVTVILKQNNSIQFTFQLNLIWF